MIYSVNAYAYAKKVGDGWNCNMVSYDKKRVKTTV